MFTGETKLANLLDTTTFVMENRSQLNNSPLCQSN